MDKTSNENKAILTVYFSIAGNIGLAVIKGLAGILGNSFALIADAIESTSDVAASFLLLLGLKYSKRPADENHPYGHGRIEPLITFVLVGFLITSAVIIIVKAVENLRSPKEMPAAWTLIVLGGIILWKEIFYRFVFKKSKETNSSTLKAEAWHHRSDALTSIAAFIGISIALIFGEGYQSADDWAAIFAACFILYNSYLIFRPALGEIMDENVYDDLIEDIRRVAATEKGIKGTEKCLIRKIGLRYHVDLHAMVSAEITVKEGHHLAHKLKDRLMSEIPQIADILIHIEPFERKYTET